MFLNIVHDQSQLEWPRWLSYVTCTSHLLTTLNCSGDHHNDNDNNDENNDSDNDEQS